ncbi:MAG: endonuclease/exonuclease/phosphatase family protein [Candidatus Woesearchaeota archaeon]
MVRLIVYNIEYCEGITGKRWLEYLKFWRVLFPPKMLDIKIMEAIKKLKPDILALVEVDIGSIRARKDRGRFFETSLDMMDIVEIVNYPKIGWLKLLSYVPILNKQANALIAKYQFSNIRHHVLSKGVKRIVIEATVKLPKEVTLLLAHLSLGKRARRKQITELTQIVTSISNPVILMGDFNTFKGEKEIMELLEKTHLFHKYKMNSSILTQPSVNPKRCMDYVLTSKDIHIKNYKVLNYDFSDHLPILVDFDVN